LPVTGSDVFGREEDIAFLDRAPIRLEFDDNIILLLPRFFRMEV
jgi:hypothetical protein